jgi:hypothetical protein
LAWFASANKRANSFLLIVDLLLIFVEWRCGLAIEKSSYQDKRNFKFAANYLIFEPIEN